MGSVGDCYDNPLIEVFWSRMQVELLDTRRWKTRIELANAVFEYIEIFHNRRRRHSALGMRTPIEPHPRPRLAPNHLAPLARPKALRPHTPRQPKPAAHSQGLTQDVSCGDRGVVAGERPLLDLGLGRGPRQLAQIRLEHHLCHGTLSGMPVNLNGASAHFGTRSAQDAFGGAKLVGQ